MKPKISIVVPTYNRVSLLKKCLDSLLAQNYSSYEIIIVNDGSTDDTKKYLDNISKKNRNIQVIHQKNEGYGVSRNVGFIEAKGDIVASTDDDCIVDNNWLNKIYASFKSNPKISAVGGSINENSNSKIAWAQYILNYSSWFPEGKPRLVKDIPTANIAYRKKDIFSLRFKTKNKKAGYSDTMFNRELRKKDGKILFDPNIKVFNYRWTNSVSYKEFLNIQQRKGIGFVLRGYKAHERIGKILIKIKFLNFLQLRLLLVSYRCLKAGYFKKFLWTFPLLFLGELEYAKTIINYKKII